jgi:hypothetical protein
VSTKAYRELRKIQGNPIVDHRKGDRHKNRSGHTGSNKELSKWDRRLIVAWDGEGCNTRDGTHIYNLLANSDGTRIINPTGIPTREALDFFIKYGKPTAINVIYGGSYDVNMILRDVPKDHLMALWRNGDTFWKNYRIFYAPRKKLTVQKFILSGDKPVKKTFTLWDVLGYFQNTFVGACKKWLGDLPILDEIQNMKFERSVFTPDRLEAIVDYNQKECDLLVKLMEALFEALDNAGIRLTRYDGAGSIASALLRANEVNDHKGEPTIEVSRAGQFCYSGGRIEATKIGNEERPIFRYDINSAYPYSCLTLPSYREATWTHDRKWDGQDSSMVMLEWHILPKYRQPFNPLWYREYDGRILYPYEGMGLYFGVEARNLIDYYPPECYDILEAYNVHLANDYKPFGFLERIYHARLVLKKAGNMASEAFKLGMNSTYGKLAQQAGYRNGRIPSYHQLLWAGQITATTRAQLYRAAMEKPQSVIAFATDAVITTEELSLDTGQGLGQWTGDKFDGITIVQPGVYWLKTGDSWQDKYRGFDKGSLLREHIVGSWVLGQNYEASLTRFVGMGSALASTDFYGHWRTWEVQQRTLSITPAGKRQPSNDVCYWDHLCDTMPTFNLGVGVLSHPYPLIWIEGPDAKTRWTQEVDLNLLEEELIDTYA